MNNPFADLQDSPLDAPARAPRAVAERPKFPCQSCAGTGRYRGIRIHQTESACFACGGRGFFLKSHEDRAKARAKSAASKATKLQAVREAFDAENPGLVDFMRENTWSGFLRELLTKVEQYGSLTDGQVAAVRRTQLKVAERNATRQAERAVEQAARTVPVDLSPIHAMFDKARAAGLNRLAYRAEGLVLSPAKATSANAGAIYVKTVGGDYLGKVIGQAFQANRDATDEHKAAIKVIAENPAEAASRYGIRTGTCSCCGRELTDPDSIAAGIGPICAEKWF